MSASSAVVSTPSTPSFLDSRIIRIIVFILPTAVLFGPLASIPYNSGGWGSLYRVLYVPAAIIFFLVWKHHGRPLFVGMRSMLLFTGLAALVGTFMVLVLQNDSERGAADHYILIVSLVIAWFTAAAVSCDQTVRNLLLSGWYVAYMIAAVMAILHLLGLFIPPTPFGLLASQYLAAGLDPIGYAGVLGNANDLGPFALAGAPLAYLAARRWDSQWWKILVVAAVVTMVLLSGSRAAIAGLLLLPLVFIALRRSNKPGQVSVILVVAAYTVLLFGFLYSVLLRSWMTTVPYLDRVIGEIETGLNASDNDRFNTWFYLFDLSIEQFPFGVGPGQFEELVGVLYFSLDSNVHNVFVEVLFEYGGLVGVAGLAWFAVVAYSVVKSARLARSEDVSVVVSAGAVALVGLALWGSVTSSLITRPQWALLLGTAIGLISSVSSAGSDARSAAGEQVPESESAIEKAVETASQST